MKKNTPEHVHVEGTRLDGETFFHDAIKWTSIEVRNPKRVEPFSHLFVRVAELVPAPARNNGDLRAHRLQEFLAARCLAPVVPYLQHVAPYVGERLEYRLLARNGQVSGQDYGMPEPACA